jgi:hypothetical protein
MLDRVNAHTIGAVMNKVRATSGSYYYGYGNYEPSSSNGRPKSGQRKEESASEHRTDD